MSYIGVLIICDFPSPVSLKRIILTISKTYSVFESDKLPSELGISDWMFHQVCVNEK
jgi:hypothetical protein